MEENIKTFVVDSSAILAILLPDEKESLNSKKLIKIFTPKNRLIAPSLLEFEVGNSLRSGILSKRITISQAKYLFDSFKAIKINFEVIDRHKVLEFAIKHNLSFYDASYLYLALVNKCKLLTLDKNLSSIKYKRW